MILILTVSFFIRGESSLGFSPLFFYFANPPLRSFTSSMEIFVSGPEN